MAPAPLSLAISRQGSAAAPIRWLGGRRNPRPGVPVEPLVLDVGGRVADVLLWRGDPRLALGPGGGPGALLCNFTDVDPAAEEEFNDWYDTEHLPRLSAVPGVLGARRYIAAEGSPRYLAFYELSAADVCQSPDWRGAAGTPWTARLKRFTKGFQSFLFEKAP